MFLHVSHAHRILGMPANPMPNITSTLRSHVSHVISSPLPMPCTIRKACVRKIGPHTNLAPLPLAKKSNGHGELHFAEMIRHRLKFLLRSVRRRHDSQFVPPTESGRTHESQMNTTQDLFRSLTELPDQYLTPNDREQLSQNASEQLKEMQKDPEEWASFLQEIDLFANGYFLRDE